MFRAATGDTTVKAFNPDHAPDFATFARIGLFRPVQFIFTEPLVFIVSVLSATAFALIYLFTEALQVVYTDMGLSTKEATLPFLGAAVGVMCSSATRVYDHRVYMDLRRRRHAIMPEDKLFGFSVGAPALVIGMW